MQLSQFGGEQDDNKLAFLKERANEKYREIKTMMENYKTLSNEYTDLLKEIENELIKTRFL